MTHLKEKAVSDMMKGVFTGQNLNIPKGTIIVLSSKKEGLCSRIAKDDKENSNYYDSDGVFKNFQEKLSTQNLESKNEREIETSKIIAFNIIQYSNCLEEISRVIEHITDKGLRIEDYFTKQQVDILKSKLKCPFIR